MTSRPLLRPSRSRTTRSELVDQRQDPFRVVGDNLPGRRRHDPATSALEQRRAVVALQRLDLGRDRRLADPFGLGGRRHRAVLDHGEEDRQRMQAGTLDHAESSLGGIRFSDRFHQKSYWTLYQLPGYRRWNEETDRLVLDSGRLGSGSR